MKHEIYRVKSFTRVGPFALKVDFTDGFSKAIDFEPVLSGELFAELRDPRIFEQVSIDPDVHTLVWPNGADFDPQTLHDWPENPAEVRNAVKNWPVSGKDAQDKLAAKLH